MGVVRVKLAIGQRLFAIGRRIEYINFTTSVKRLSHACAVLLHRGACKINFAR